MIRRSLTLLCLAVVLAACSSSSAVPADPTAGSGAAPAEPAPGVVVRRTDFHVTYKLDGVSEAGSAVGLGWNRQLEARLSVPLGTTVAEGETIGAFVVPDEVAAALEAGQGSIGTARLSQLRAMEGPVVAPVAGIVADGGGRPVIQSPGVDVVVELSPIQDLRYQSLQLTGRAVVETVLGPREVPCSALWLEEIDPGGQSTDDPAAPVVSTFLHCRIPSHIETVPRLRARLVLESETITGAAVVPADYVGYDDEADGYYIRVADGDGVSEIPVTVGVTDGVVRVITSDVPVGAELVPLEEG